MGGVGLSTNPLHNGARSSSGPRIALVSSSLLLWAVTHAPTPESSVSQGACNCDCAEPAFSYHLNELVFPHCWSESLLEHGPSGTFWSAVCGAAAGVVTLTPSRYAMQASSRSSLSKGRRVLRRYAGEDDPWRERLLREREGGRGEGGARRVSVKRIYPFRAPLQHQSSDPTGI